MSAKGHRTVSRSEYHDYMRSEKWQETRRRWFASKYKKICYVCGNRNGPFDLHHRTYKNLGNERLMDLVLVCRECHQLIHAMYDARPDKRDGMWQVTKKARKKALARRKSR